jgi:hypothetical protein
VPLAVVVAAAASLPVALAALAVVAVHQTLREPLQQLSVAALALEAKAMLAVLVFVRRATRPVKAAAVVVLVQLAQQPHPPAALEPAALVSPTPSRPGLRNPTLAAVVVDRSLTHIPPVDRVAVVVAHLELAARQLLVRQIQAVVVVVELPTGLKTLPVAAPASLFCATASLNFSTGEANETIDSGHCCGTDLDGLRYKPRRVLRCHRCA